MHVYGRNARNVYLHSPINMQPRNSSTGVVCRIKRCFLNIPQTLSVHSRHAIKMTKIWLIMFSQCSRFLKVISLETTIISENRPTFENKPILHFLMKLLQRVLFSLKSTPTYLFRSTWDHVSKKHQRSSTLQEEGLTNEARRHLLLLHKCMTKEALQDHCRRT